MLLAQGTHFENHCSGVAAVGGWDGMSRCGTPTFKFEGLIPLSPSCCLLPWGLECTVRSSFRPFLPMVAWGRGGGELGAQTLTLTVEEARLSQHPVFSFSSWVLAKESICISKRVVVGFPVALEEEGRAEPGP